jgi:hypothetical protein
MLRWVIALVSVGLLAPAEAGAAYAKRKRITVDRSRVGASGAPLTLASYPLLYSVVDPDLRTTAHGGHVTSSQGHDIAFTSCGDPGACALLDHEIETYDPITGTLVAWVRLPSLNTRSASADTELFLHYSDVTVTTSRQDRAGVWDSAYAAVWHLAENPAASTDCAGGAGTREVCDSTGSGLHGEANGGMTAGSQGAGQVNGSLGFSGASGQNIDLGDANALDGLSAMTVSAWVKPAITSGEEAVVSKLDDAAWTGWWLAAGGTPSAGNVAVDATSTGTGSVNTITIPHTTSGSSRLMLVAVSYVVEQTTVDVSGITYDGASLSQVCELTSPGADTRLEIWSLVAPGATTADVVVSFSGASGYGKVVGVTTFTGVDQIDPLGPCAMATGGSVGVSSAAGELVFGAVVSKDSAVTEGAGQSSLWNLSGAGTAGTAHGGGSIEPGAPMVTTSWSGVAEGNVGGVSIRPSAGGAMDADTVRVAFDSSTAETAGNAIDNGVWGHWAMVFDGSQAGNAGRLQIYVNGIQQALTFTGTIPAVTPATAHALRLAATSDGAHFFNGVLDEVRISTVARSVHWIATEHSNMSSPATFVSVGLEEDMLEVAFLDATASGAESVSPAGLMVRLAAPSGLPTTVRYAVSGGTAAGGGADYTLASGTLTFAPGETTLSIPVAVVNDAAHEANETVVVTLSEPVNAVLGATATHTYTIVDDDELVSASPPRIVSEPALKAWCGVPYSYGAGGGPAAEGTAPLTWSVGEGAPGGFEVDAASGQIRWTPTRDQAGSHSVEVVVSNVAGVDRQEFQVEVVCEGPAVYGLGCGCDAGGGGWPMAWAALCFMALLRSTRWRTGQRIF